MIAPDALLKAMDDKNLRCFGGINKKHAPEMIEHFNAVYDGDFIKAFKRMLLHGRNLTRWE